MSYWIVKAVAVIVCVMLAVAVVNAAWPLVVAAGVAWLYDQWAKQHWPTQ